MRLDMTTIRDAAVRIYKRHFGEGAIDGALVDEFIDSSGNEAVKVVIVAKEGQIDTLLGGTLGDAALDLQDELTTAGEERFAYIGYGEAGEIQIEDETEEDDDVSNMTRVPLGRS
ncbi:hypothetical protein ASG54_04050 [Aureimonas sp. Leaf460]|nr:hypothetical protein ASG62_19680 [Aureimonas sp. Leaf427]KQT72439.1 hypothetical protein ASG54_04050 [Aureimonas sp. Leaf460]